MIKATHKLIFIFIGLLSLAVFSQNKKTEKGDKKFESYAYVNAIEIYEKLINKGYRSPELFQKLADAYYFNGELLQASKWYNALFGLTEQLPAEYFYRYAQALKATKSYGEADKYLKLFAAKQPADPRSKLIIENPNYLQDIEKNSGRYQVLNLPINSKYSDYGASVYQNKLVFTSARDTGTISKRIYTWTNHPFTTLYQSEIYSDGSLGKAEKFDGAISSKFNESTAVFTKDGQTMYFTRNNYNKGIRGRDVSGTTLLKIYRSVKENGKWNTAEELPFNSDNFSCAHPCLTVDEKWLYFASDRQGGQGQSDLYKVEILPRGNFGHPINLGVTINTGGRESFPFVSRDNVLYFASDGHPGLGGLDIFAVKILDDGSLGVVKNIGTPANSEFDDFAFTINSETKKGFLSSNRDLGRGKDDLYSVFEMHPLILQCFQKISGNVYDTTTKTTLEETKITLFDRDFKWIAEVYTDADGNYEFKGLDCGQRYRVNARLKEYNTAEVTVDLPDVEGGTLVHFGLEKTRVKVEKGDDLFKILKLAPIYFDFNSADIRADAAVELAKVVAVLEQYANMKIDIRAHTDSRGNDEYNLKLSERRAQSTKNWIIAQGIEMYRLFAKGYGETQLINDCQNGSDCSEQEHQENRRSEFIVLEL